MSQTQPTAPDDQVPLGRLPTHVEVVMRVVSLEHRAEDTEQRVKSMEDVVKGFQERLDKIANTQNQILIALVISVIMLLIDVIRGFAMSGAHP